MSEAQTSRDAATVPLPGTNDAMVRAKNLLAEETARRN